uniref:Uncharacterized protein n=1 Tax=Cairina moschata TaxID=8855 RepID=A0A8C3BVY3_CAIMO
MGTDGWSPRSLCRGAWGHPPGHPPPPSRCLPPRGLTRLLLADPVGAAAVLHQGAGLLPVQRGLAVPRGLLGLGSAAQPGVPAAAVRVAVAVGMAVPPGAVVVEEAEPQQVDHQPRHPHGDDHQRLLDLVGLGEALDGLQQDGEAEGGEEDGVDQGAHHLGAHPAEGVLLGGAGALGEAHGHQRHHQRHDVGQHVEGVGQHGQRRRHAAHRHLHHEEEEGEPQHAQQPRATLLPPPPPPPPPLRHRRRHPAAPGAAGPEGRTRSAEPGAARPSPGPERGPGPGPAAAPCRGAGRANFAPEPPHSFHTEPEPARPRPPARSPLADGDAHSRPRRPPRPPLAGAASRRDGPAPPAAPAPGEPIGGGASATPTPRRRPRPAASGTRAKGARLRTARPAGGAGGSVTSRAAVTRPAAPLREG